MPAWLNKATIYIFAWILYNTQGLILPKGSVLGQILVVILILVSLYYAFVANTRYRLGTYFWGLDILLIMFSIYGFYLIINYNPTEFIVKKDPSSYLKSIYISLTPIFAFFVFFKEKIISEKSLYFFIFLFFLTATGQYFQNQQEMLTKALLLKSSAEEFTNNIGYVFVSLIPICVFLYKKILVQYLALGYIMIFLFMSMKRGALIIGVLCIVWFLWNSLKKVSFSKKTGLIILSIILSTVGYLYVEKQMQESLYFQKRVEQTLEGSSSGRDKLFARFVDYYLDETSPVQFVFGSGANATLKVSYNYAHNDWLEIAVNQGMLGLLVFLFYWILFAKEIMSKSHNLREKLALQLLFIIYFMQTLFSMSYNDMTIPASFTLGYCLAQEKKNEQIIYCN